MKITSSRLLLSLVTIFGLSYSSYSQDTRQARDRRSNCMEIRITDDTCDVHLKGTIVINRCPSQTVSGKVIFVTQDSVRKFINRNINVNHLKPGESRYLGCSGCTQVSNHEKCIGYVIDHQQRD